jgi:hypothetical protein
MVDAKIRVTFHEFCSFELCTIVCQDSSRHAESVYDALQELDRCLLGYINHWHGFHPLGGYVNCDE